MGILRDSRLGKRNPMGKHGGGEQERDYYKREFLSTDWVGIRPSNS